MGKYYKYQSPTKTVLWAVILTLSVTFPFAESSIAGSVFQSILGGESAGDGSEFAILPFLLAFIIFALIFKRKHPRSVVIIFNSYMIALLAFYMPTLSNNIMIFIEGVMSGFEFENMGAGVYASVSVFWFIASTRIIKKLKKSFADCEPENDNIIMVLWILVILIHVIGIGITVVSGVFMPDELPEITINIPGISAFAGMLGYIYYIFPGVFVYKLAMGAYKTIKEFQKRKKKKSSWGLTEALIIVLFVFVWFPILGPLIDHGENTRDNSVYNPSWSGNSDFKTLINETMGYDTYSIQSSLSALTRMDRPVCLVIMAPQTTFNPLSEVPFFIEMLKNPYFSMLICDDHGSTSTLMTNLFISSFASGNPVPLGLFPDGILWDNVSYDTNPMFPVIKDFTSHYTTQGVSEVILSNASALLGGTFFNLLTGWDTIGQTATGENSFIDRNGDGRYNSTEDVYPLPDAITNIIGDVASEFEDGYPLGGQKQVPFACKELNFGNRIFLTTDASMFNNELLDSYDNAQFGKNIINWLTKQNKSIAVVFDESHNIPYGTREFSSVAMFGFIQGYVNWLSTNPLISWIYPLYALRTVKRWLPKDEDKKKKKKKEEIRSSKERDELQFRTSSFFAQKINWYRINQEYNQALILLNRRVERKVMNLMEGVAPTAVNIIEKISAERGKYLSKVDLERIRNYLEKMEAIKSKQIEVVDILEFNDIFFEMNWFNENF